MELAAGSNSMKGAGGTAKDCLKFEQRASTPPEIRKYRRSTQLVPGTRFQHYGVSDDYANMDLGNKTYGATSERGNNTAADLLMHEKLGNLERLNKMKAEKVYHTVRREPLGRCMERDTVLPDKFTEGQQPFGISTNQRDEPAKEVIFPTLSEDDLRAEAIYIRTHGNWGAGEQKSRGYDWHGIDPTRKVFGVKGNTVAFNGVSQNIADVLNSAGEQNLVVATKRVEDFRNMGDMLGRTKNLGQGSGARPFDTVYGKPSGAPRKSGKPTLTAQEVMKGKYPEQALQPDVDLGKSITPGFRNISLEDRSYGCPSIRTDLPAHARARRSLADSQNYGDDAPAQDLINPPPFSDLSIAPTVMSEMRPKDRVINLFTKIGYQLSRDVADALFEEACELSDSVGTGACTVNDFRNVLNAYLGAVDNGREGDWLYAHGIPVGK